MKIVFHNYWLLPPPGFCAIVWFGKIIVKRKYEAHRESYFFKILINHESIHEVQVKECGGWVRFYLRYVWQWARVGFKYRKIPFEREAYNNDTNLNYLKTRKPFAWKKN